MTIFDYYDTELGILDVFKTVDFSSVLDTIDYSVYTPNDGDNLMSISDKFYRNIDDWWVLYYFNEMTDITFAILGEKTLTGTVDFYMNLLSTYDTATLRDKLIIKEAVIQYHLQYYTLRESITMAVAILEDPVQRSAALFVNDFRNFVYGYIIINTMISSPIKIPDTNIVFQMKTIMNNYSIAWKQN